MLLRLALTSILGAVVLMCAPSAFAAGGNYQFAGGTHAEQMQVEAALNASSFPWGIVPGPVTVHIAPGIPSSAAYNEIWLDADLLDAGRFAWGVVQHEYAHEVDFAVLTPAIRDQLHLLLHGLSWWSGSSSVGEGHSDLDCERFADLVAWSYWMSPDNVMKPESTNDEGGQMTPVAFRAALAALIPGVHPDAPVAQAVRTTASAGAGHKPKR